MTGLKTEEKAGLLLVVVAIVFITLAIVFDSWWFILWGIAGAFVLPYVILWAAPRLAGGLRTMPSRLHRPRPWHRKQLQRKEHIAQLEAEIGVPVATEGECSNKGCGKPLPVGAKFCAYCGTPTVRKAVLCPKCRTRLPEDGQYCPECGNQVRLPTFEESTRDTPHVRRPVHQ